LDWVERVASGVVLIATDLDGTLAEIAPRADDVRLDARVRVVLERLARAPATHVAIVSGRTLPAVRGCLGEVGPVWLSGDHGAVVVDPQRRVHVFDDGAYDGKLRLLQSRADDPARVFRGARVEVKPRSIALHYREVPPHKRQALAEMFSLSCAAHGAKPLRGRMVVEGRFGAGNKGAALEYIMSRLPNGAGVIYVGDDTTDEPALAYAHGHPFGLALHVQSDERTPPASVHGWLAGPTEWLEILEALASVRTGPRPVA
jgi:trehalose-phosphatase